MIELQSNMYKFVYTQILFHELVHVGQWVRGDLQFRQGKLCYSQIPIDNFDYRDQPHEVEAREMEKPVCFLHGYDERGIGTSAMETAPCSFILGSVQTNT